MIRARLFLALVFVAACHTSPSHPAHEPRLAVLVVFDQLRALDLERLHGVLGSAGFGGLEGRGAARYDAHYSYAETETGPGHATLSTGANPSVHGIISNYWFQDGRMIYAIADKTAPVLGGPADPALNKGASARQLRAGTLGDAMKAESQGKARVVTVSLKDRSAILSGGLSADLAIWYDVSQGRFTSSRAYTDALPAWAEALATTLPERSMTEGTWSPLAPSPGVTPPEDASSNEAAEAVFRDAFPHDLKAIEKMDDRRVDYRGTPQSMADTFAIAKAALVEKSLALGEDEIPDLLVVSISSTDYVGHGYGPLSLESFDLLRRADRELKDLVVALDRKLGPRGYVLAVSSDHAATPLAEQVKKAGVDAGRISASRLKERIDEALQQLVKGGVPSKAPHETQQMLPMAQPKAAPTGSEASKPHVIAKDSTKARPTYRFVQGFAPPHIFLDLSQIAPALRGQAIATARAVIEATPGIAATYTPDELRAGEPDPFAEAYREALFDDQVDHAQRHGTILVRQKARWVYAFDDETVGTDHGTPYSYDAFVPFIVMGPGVRGGRYAQPCDVRDVAPTLAFLLRGPRPDHAQGRPVSAVGAD